MFLPNYASIPGERRVKYIMPKHSFFPEDRDSRFKTALEDLVFPRVAVSSSLIH